MKYPSEWIRQFAGRALIGSGLVISSSLLAQEPPRDRVSPPTESAATPPPVEAPVEKEGAEQAGRKGEPGMKRLLKQGAFRGPERSGPRGGREVPMNVGPRRPEAGPHAGQSKGPEHALPPRAKIHHLKRAAEALAAAGYPEYAEKARMEIKRLEERAIRDEARPKYGPPDQELRGEIARMRKEVEELRQQVRRLKAASPEVRPERPQ